MSGPEMRGPGPCAYADDDPHGERLVAISIYDNKNTSTPSLNRREALGSRRASQGNQFGLRRAVENSRTGRVRIVLARQRRLESFLHQLSSRVTDGVDAGIQGRCDFAVRPTFARLRRVGFEQDARLRDQLRRSLARVDHPLEALALLGAQFHHVLLYPCTRSCHESSPSSPRPRGSREFRNAPNFQGRERLDAHLRRPFANFMYWLAAALRRKF